MSDPNNRFLPIAAVFLTSLGVGTAISSIGSFNSQPSNLASNSLVAAQTDTGVGQSYPVASAPAGAPALTTQIAPADGSAVAINGSDCRRVVFDGLVVYTEPNPGSAIIGRALFAEQQVGLINGNTTPSIGSDGQNYLQVSVPYGATDANVGFVRTQLPNATGTPASTLGLCTSLNPSPSPRPPVSGRW